MSRTRTFIGIDIGDGVRGNAVSLQEALAKTGADVKWVTPESMHLTLLFLGEVDDRELHPVCKAVQAVAAGEPPFTLHVSGVGAFPTPRRPKVLWAGVTTGADALQRLNAALEEKMLDLGCYRTEERGYTPHLTLGRVKGEADGLTVAPELQKRLTWNGGRVPVGEILVYSSSMERDGPVYTVIGRAPLTGSPT
ncbi:RNA 2',3'-cyclic phosphodiesterase [Frigoriglobus tundricola]|uniref:RNA 2',3'-cyclic phosphodiesterase n=1 Tax=Frigoriglobus tundricola TaxID=2774151 RepID=A0A6M5YNH8_9BACT|nr:RNA 2',3'-cyclic phosphodiesterase [Frigoriglobus tundricola]QJW95607.1 2'-5' RNA ligase [Frigoriglobus tundricola]